MVNLKSLELQPAKTALAFNDFLPLINFDSRGLIPAIAQDNASGEVLMLAWANLEAIKTSLIRGYACYYSRSRQKLWLKGESSGQMQKIHSISLDCDADAILYKVEQIGVACHTGRRSCFYIDLNLEQAQINSDIIVPSNELYSHNK